MPWRRAIASGWKNVCYNTNVIIHINNNNTSSTPFLTTTTTETTKTTSSSFMTTSTTSNTTSPKIGDDKSNDDKASSSQIMYIGAGAGGTVSIVIIVVVIVIVLIKCGRKAQTGARYEHNPQSGLVNYGFEHTAEYRDGAVTFRTQGEQPYSVLGNFGGVSHYSRNENTYSTLQDVTNMHAYDTINRISDCPTTDAPSLPV
ncbi:uncharacterized protein LOC127846677 [Dreissena polymorpha]|uniref:Uncharacterized protein n=1 Tax=Dreissena polymorpha TaxID=45954 RepID=A0A9D4DX66_DREPO|nr:uncharacterized protein LOC127846677 [Dreissena polymorpha]KAH3769659.1 hypothetical protein DPMN_170933 [Dreissena polymorpha]